MFKRLVLAALSLAAATAAQAHPHVWVTMTTEVVYAADGTVTGLRHAWAFDDMFSSFATQGLESKEKGKFTREELAPLAKVNVESLKEFNYFTVATVDGKKAELSEPLADYYLDYKDEVLTLNFTLPFAKPAKAKDLTVDVYDATMFVDFAFAKDKPVKLSGAPAGCTVATELPPEMTREDALRLSQIPADQPNTVMAWGAKFAQKILVRCK
ncbi:MAG: DUF1007 family protein [Pseudolabrys sp.]